MENLDDLVRVRRSSTERRHGLTIVITGATSGVGLYAAKLLALVNPRNQLILVGRSIEKAMNAKKQVVDSLLAVSEENNGLTSDGCGCSSNSTAIAADERILALECDHCSLSSIKEFCRELRRTLKETSSSLHQKNRTFKGIDVLCLNAGVLLAEGSLPQFTKDGLEITFQTNHLASFLIANLTRDLMNPGGRIVFTASGLHVGKQLVDLSGAIDPVTGDARKGFDMLDGSEFHFKQCYTLSKLCNVAVCAELSQRLRSENVTVNCFSPGLILSSRLFRHQGSDPTDSITFASGCSHKESILRKAKSLEWGGGSLAFMAMADETGQQSGEYWSDTTLAGLSARYGTHFCATPITNSTIDDEMRRALWQLSCQLSDIPCD